MKVCIDVKGKQSGNLALHKLVLGITYHFQALLKDEEQRHTVHKYTYLMLAKGMYYIIEFQTQKVTLESSSTTSSRQMRKSMLPNNLLDSQKISYLLSCSQNVYLQHTAKCPFSYTILASETTLRTHLTS